MRHGKKDDNTNHFSEFMLQKDEDSVAADDLTTQVTRAVATMILT